jgi:protein-tyrosine phosphatase
MSTFRYYCPETVNQNLWYLIGKGHSYIQPYWNTKFDANEIVERIYIGDISSSMNKEEMKKNGITHIVTVINGGTEMFPDDFKYKIIHINDDSWVDIGSHFDEAIDFINHALELSEHNKILIHCKRGISRSVTILMAYLLHMENSQKKIIDDLIDERIEEYVKLIKNRRPIANPNKGFIESLKHYITNINSDED